jgi:hypothetical protein
MRPLTHYRRIQARFAAVILTAAMMLCTCLLLGSASLPKAAFAGADSDAVVVSPVYLIAPAGGEGLDQYKAKALSKKLVEKYLGPLSGRVKFVNKDYFSFTDKDCDPGKVCEVVQITVAAAKSSRVTYGIDNQLLPNTPDKRIWPEKEPPSCDISDTRPATECDDHILHVLANKLLSHDETAHRPSL